VAEHAPAHGARGDLAQLGQGADDVTLLGSVIERQKRRLAVVVGKGL
jgi:hypothetical protein